MPRLSSRQFSLAGSQVLIVDVPKNEWLSLNDKPGTRRQISYQRAKARRLRERAFYLAKSARLKPVTGPVLIEAYVHGRVARLEDPENVSPTTKPIIDALVDVGVLADDNYQLVEGPNHLHGDPISTLPVGWHRIVLVIVPLDQEAA